MLGDGQEVLRRQASREHGSGFSPPPPGIKFDLEKILLTLRSPVYAKLLMEHQQVMKLRQETSK